MVTGAGRYRDGITDEALTNHGERIKAMEVALALDGPFDRRIKRLEIWRSWVLGVGAAIIFFAGIFTSTLWGLLKQMFGHG